MAKICLAEFILTHATVGEEMRRLAEIASTHISKPRPDGSKVFGFDDGSELCIRADNSAHYDY